MNEHPFTGPINFLAGGGELGALIRAHDWASTPLGPPERWPQSLRLTVRLMLNTHHPMFIWWGPNLIQFYNDAYRQTMGPQMHPQALGAKGRESWSEIWPIIGPQIEHVMAGKGATWNVDAMVPINRSGTPEEVWWTYGYSPIDLEGEVGGVLVVCTDVTEQHQQTEALRTATERLARQFEVAPGFIAVMRGQEHTFELANAAYRKLIGQREVVGLPVRQALPEVEGQGFFELLDRVLETGEPYVGRRTKISLADPSSSAQDHYLDFVYQPITEPDGRVSGIFVEGQDVTDHVRTEDRLTLINAELRHRVKNTLAMVGAVARQTFRDSASRDAMDAFEQRLQAFGSANDALAEATDRGTVREVIERALAPHQPRIARYRWNGPTVLVGTKQTVSLSLAIHELATNAAKYGALSTDAGNVEITWSIEAELFRLEWRESGGPAVQPPQRVGFGSRLIRSSLAADFGGTVEMTYDPAGFIFLLLAPAANALDTPE